ncbi:MAG: acylphosphatase [Rhodospirillaceae bacterium]|jgi:acylphosphatase|nr:acylphosphatase [Rhodospirillaceae bacterium]MBT6119572.1 acylphosphatase [Rhodospirillaceae bacterium]
MAAGDETAVRARIEGRVQNVWYRAWTVEQAKARGLRGWVRNCADGSVEALFVGPAATVEAMIDACRVGPPDARVTNIAREAAEDDGSQGFSQVSTV